MTDWRLARLEDLDARELHDILQARSAVFVVEQACAFQDVDGADPESWHLFAEREGRLAAYCRLVPPGVKFREPSIGRVMTTAPFRATGLGRKLMAEALRQAAALWPGSPVRLGGQHHLQRFYESLGFAVASEPYDEDGIPHVEMLHPGGKP